MAKRARVQRGKSALEPKPRWRFEALTPERWQDLRALFGARGACGGCWCMFWRLARSQWERQKGAANERALQALVEAGAEPGLIAYAGEEPVGWCAYAPREHYPALERSRVLKRVDAAPVWSISCLFIARAWRRKGLSSALLCAVAERARERGAQTLEGYPVEPRSPTADAFVWTGVASAFRAAGFRELARRSATRPIMRLELAAARSSRRARR